MVPDARDMVAQVRLFAEVKLSAKVSELYLWSNASCIIVYTPWGHGQKVCHDVYQRDVNVNEKCELNQCCHTHNDAKKEKNYHFYYFK